jgi:hypothetical protein
MYGMFGGLYGIRLEQNDLYGQESGGKTMACILVCCCTMAYRHCMAFDTMVMLHTESTK